MIGENQRVDAAFDVLWSKWDEREAFTPAEVREITRAARVASKGDAYMLRSALQRMRDKGAERPRVSADRFDEHKHPDLWTQPEIDAFVAWMRAGGPDFKSFTWEKWCTTYWGMWE